MSLAKVLAQQETAISDARIAQLSDCKFLSEQEVIELAAKCKVGAAVCCSCRQLQAARHIACVAHASYCVALQDHPHVCRVF
jgi:hypothetical protein